MKAVAQSKKGCRGWGFAILGNDYFNAEWGYISFAEPQSINVNGIEIDCELDWRIFKASEIEKIRIAHKQQK